MKKLLQLEEKLKKAKEELEKNWLGGTQTSGQTGGVTQGTAGSGSGPSIAEQIGFGKNEMMGYGEDDVNTVSKDEGGVNPTTNKVQRTIHDKRQPVDITDIKNRTGGIMSPEQQVKAQKDAKAAKKAKAESEAKARRDQYRKEGVLKAEECVKYDKNGQWSIEKTVRKPDYGSEELYEGNYRKDAPPRGAKYRGGDPRHSTDRLLDDTKAGAKRDLPNPKNFSGLKGKGYTGGASNLKQRYTKSKK